MVQVKETFVSVDSGSRDRSSYPEANRFRVFFDRPPLQSVVSCDMVSMVMSVIGLENVSVGSNDFRWSESAGGREFAHGIMIPTGNYSEEDLAVAVQNALNDRTIVQREAHAPRAYGCSFSRVDKRFYITLLMKSVSGVAVLPCSIGRLMGMEFEPPSTYVESRCPVDLSPQRFLYLSVPNMDTGVAYARGDDSGDELPYLARLPAPNSNGMFFCNVCQPGFQSLTKRFAPPLGYLGGMELRLTDRTGRLAALPQGVEYSCLFRFRVLERGPDEGM